MKDENGQKRGMSGFLLWAPRALLVALGLALLFFPLDQFSNTGLGILLNRIPSFVFLAIASVSWDRPAWAPRIFTGLFIPFLMIFSLDVFSENLGLWGTVLGLILHNIPAVILLVIAIISWRHELVGAVIFNLAGLLYIWWMTAAGHPIPMTWHVMLNWFMGIGAPAMVVGMLYLIEWAKKRKSW